MYILAVFCTLELGASPSVRRWRGCQPADQFQLINGLFIHFIHFYTLYTLLNPLYTAALSGQNTRTGTHPHFLHWHWHCSHHFCRYWSSYFYCLAVTPWQEMWMWTETVSISWQSWKPSVSSLSSTCWYTPSSLPSLPGNDASDITMIGKLEAELSDLYFL